MAFTFVTKLSEGRRLMEDTRDDLKAEVSEAPKSDAVRPDTRSDVSTFTTVSVA